MPRAPPTSSAACARPPRSGWRATSAPAAWCWWTRSPAPPRASCSGRSCASGSSRRRARHDEADDGEAAALVRYGRVVPMKVGVLQFFSWPERRTAIETVYERALQRIEVMDRTGYDAVWLAEHHFHGFSVCPSVHMMGVHVAARTRRLRIGTAVSLAAFYHPLRLAEEVALLDVLSGGRVNWGAGRGFDRTEFQA